MSKLSGRYDLKKVTDFPWEPANWNTTRFKKSPGILSNQMTLENKCRWKAWLHFKLGPISQLTTLDLLKKKHSREVSSIGWHHSYRYCSTLHIGIRETLFPAFADDASGEVASVARQHSCTIHIGTRETLFPALTVDASVARSLASLGNIYRYCCTHETSITFINKFDSCYYNDNYFDDCGGDSSCNSREDNDGYCNLYVAYLC